MGRMFEKYMSDYNEAIKPGMARGDKYVVQAPVWIYFKWLEDNGLPEEEPERIVDAVTEVCRQDEELGVVLIAGVEAMYLD